MKLKRLFLLPITILLITIHFVSCGVDRWPEYASQTARDEWIDSIMRENYLWYYEIPQSKYLNYFSAPSTFLQSLLYKAEDNLYSQVDTLYLEPLPSYGFNYELQKSVENDTAYYALVSYVEASSPASEAGLERGDWIMEVNGSVITRSNASTLLDSSEPLDLMIGKYEVVLATDEESKDSWKIVQTGIAEMSSIRPVVNNPIHYYSTIITTTGVRLGYLVYGEFTNGTLTDPDIYKRQLFEVSNYFAKQNITHFALDLRYNTGGSFDCSQLMATLLAPSSALGSVYATTTYNNKNTDKDGNLIYAPELIAGGTNLNIRQGFVITSNQTSASIAGTFLNCLSPLKCWALVGTNLTCWGMATERFMNPNLSWAVSPVVCYVANSEGETGQNGRFTPNVSITETSDLSTFLPFGDPDETLLNAVIKLIDGVK